MIVKKMYIYERKDGGITVAPFELKGAEYKDFRLTEREGYRLIADEGKALTNGEIITSCIDVEIADGWSEIDEPKETEI